MFLLFACWHLYDSGSELARSPALFDLWQFRSLYYCMLNQRQLSFIRGKRPRGAWALFLNMSKLVYIDFCPIRKYEFRVSNNWLWQKVTQGDQTCIKLQCKSMGMMMLLYKKKTIFLINCTYINTLLSLSKSIEKTNKAELLQETCTWCDSVSQYLFHFEKLSNKIKSLKKYILLLYEFYMMKTRRKKNKHTFW